MDLVSTIFKGAITKAPAEYEGSVVFANASANANTSVKSFFFTETGGFGTNHAASVSLSGNALTVAMHPSGTFVAVGISGSSPYVQVFNYTKESGFGTALSNPQSLPSGNVVDAEYNQAGTILALCEGQTNYPYMSVYRVNSNGTLGAKFASPAFGYGSPGKGIAIDPDSYALFQSMGSIYHTNNYDLAGTGAISLGTYRTLDLGQEVVTVYERSLAVTKTSTTGTKSYAIGNSSSPYVVAYPYTATSNGLSFGIKHSNPQVGISGATYGVTFAPNSDAIFCATQTSPYLVAYTWSENNGFGTRFTQTLSNAARAVETTPAYSNGTYHVIVGRSGTTQSAYLVSGTTFSNVSTVSTAGIVHDIAVHPG